MRWMGEGWRAEPDEVVNALASEGFEECKREVARNPVDHAQSGGVWQGLNAQTGAVASAVWVRGGDQSLETFIPRRGEVRVQPRASASAC